MRVREVSSDGNCFFRALSDQRYGGESRHASLRASTVKYMLANREHFEPFIEDDEKWDPYIARMAEDGTWAGNMEVQAASRVCMADGLNHEDDSDDRLNRPHHRPQHRLPRGSIHPAHLGRRTRRRRLSLQLQ